MAQEIEVSCPGCEAVFNVPVEFCGEMAECAECDVVFEIPRLPTEEADEGGGFKLPSTDTGAIKGVAAGDNFDGEVTNTVKLSRSGIGMIPTLKDSFQFDAPDAAGSAAKPTPTMPAAASPPTAGARSPAKKPALQRPPSPPSAPATPQAPPVAAQAPVAEERPPSATSTRSKPVIEVPPWTKIHITKNEEALAFHESSENGGGTAFLISVPALLCLVGVFIKPAVIGAVIVAVIWLITFVVALLMAKSRGKKALLMTDKRAICVIGSKRIEVKK